MISVTESAPATETEWPSLVRLPPWAMTRTAPS